jgi:lipid A 4'-phosphatase
MKDLFLRRWDLLLLLGMQAVFVLWPQIDLIAAGWLYDPQEEFFLASNPLVQLSYHVFADLHIFILITLVWFFVASWTWRRHSEAGLRRRLLFLFLALALGPGLVVNGILKSESGRARPDQVGPFGGEKTFTEVFTPADQCRKNCSFVSGHASMGFYLIALGWVTCRRRWFAVGVVAGALVGFGRMAQGAHFLSDVVFAFWAVYGVCFVLAWWLLGQRSVGDCPRAPPVAGTRVS